MLYKMTVVTQHVDMRLRLVVTPPAETHSPPIDGDHTNQRCLPIETDAGHDTSCILLPRGSSRTCSSRTSTCACAARHSSWPPDEWRIGAKVVNATRNTCFSCLGIVLPSCVCGTMRCIVGCLS